MKKRLTLILLAVLLLTACAATPSGVYEAEGVTLTVDWEQSQISDGQNLYRYLREDHPSGEKVTFTFPDGAEYICYGLDGTVTTIPGGWPDEGSGYPDNETLYAAMDAARSSDPIVFRGFGGWDVVFLIIGLCTVAFGIFFVVCPDTGWQMDYSHLVEEGRASERGLVMVQMRGWIIILGGVLMLAYVLLSVFGLL